MQRLEVNDAGVKGLNFMAGACKIFGKWRNIVHVNNRFLEARHLIHLCNEIKIQTFQE
jgi:hypothetical protein